MQFKIFKNHNLIQGISDASFGSMAGKAGDKRAQKFLKSLAEPSLSEGDGERRNKVSATGCDANIKNVVWAEQIFGSKVYVCKTNDSGKTIKGVDGLISNIENQVLAIVSADCVPILLYDPKQKAVAALHGSRKSLLKGIVKEAFSKMVSRFRCKPRDILAGIGPHIRKCHYFLDLTRITINDLIKSGVKKKNIEDCGICTFCSAKKYFSHRKKQEFPKLYKEKRSRFAGFIGLKEDKILKVTPKNFKEAVKTAVKFIIEGKVLVCPTDTVYGIICDAKNKKAVERLLKIKKRKLTKPVPIFVKDIKAAKRLAYVDKNQEEFLKKAWPGKVTAVLRKKKKQKIYGVDKKTIGLRIPNYKLINVLLKNAKKPLIGTSANVSGQPASTKIEEVIKQFAGKKPQPDLIISAGNLPKSKPSKVVDLILGKIKILRR